MGTASQVTVPVGSAVDVTLPEPLGTVTSISGSVKGAEPGVDVGLETGGLTVSASAKAATGTMTLSLSGVGCTASECERTFEIQIPVTVVSFAAPPGPLEELTEPSPDRVAAAVDHELPDELEFTVGTPESPGTRAEAEADATAVGGVIAGGLEASGIYQVRWDEPQDLSTRTAELEARPDVTSVSPATVGLYGTTSAGTYPVAPEFDTEEWTWPYEQVHAEEAWTKATGSNVTVGIIDEGNALANHEDLNVTETVGNYEPRFHATHVAGLACAKNNAVGMVGMAWGCPIVSLGIGSGWNTDAILNAMRAMAKRTAVKVVNMSIGIPAGGCFNASTAQHYEDLVHEEKPIYDQFFAGAEGSRIVWTISAGNTCAPMVGSGMAANAQLPNVLSVAATNSNEKLAIFSNFGPEVEVAAPGGVQVNPQTYGLMSSATDGDCPGFDACPAECIWQTSANCGTYKPDMGTSMAAPVVAGIAALVRSANPGLTADQAGECIGSTAGTDGAGVVESRSDLPDEQGWKWEPEIEYSGSIPIVNAAAAVECAINPSGFSMSWSAIKFPEPPNGDPEYGSSLSDPACSPDGTCFLLESYRDGDGNFRSLIRTLSGGSWSATEPPVPAGGQLEEPDWLYGTKSVCAAGDTCMLFGGAYRDAQQESHGLIYMLSNGTWSAAELPVPGGGKAGSGWYWQLYSQTCAAAVDVCVFPGSYWRTFMDGEGGEYEGNSAMVVSLSNGTWTANQMPVPPGGEPGSGSSLDGWEAGACSMDGTCVLPGEYGNEVRNDYFREFSMLETYNNGSWSATELPVPSGGRAGSGAFFEEFGRAGGPAPTEHLWCMGSSTCLAPGRYTDDGSEERDMIDMLSGGIWTATTVPIPADGEPGSGKVSDSYGACSVDICVLPGYYRTTNGEYPDMLATFVDGAWSATRAPTVSGGYNFGGSIDGSACSSDGTCVVLGRYGSVVDTFSEGTWTATDVPVPVGGRAGSAEIRNDTPPTCSSNGICVVDGEYTDTAGAKHDMLDTFIGGTWRSIEVPVPPDGNGGTSLTYSSPVACSSSVEICIVPGSYRNPKGELRSMLVVGEGKP